LKSGDGCRLPLVIFSYKPNVKKYFFYKIIS